MLQHVAECCSVLQCVAVCGDIRVTRRCCARAVSVYCSVLQCDAVRCSMLQWEETFGTRVVVAPVCCHMLPCVTVCCSELQCVAVRGSVLQWVETFGTRVVVAHKLSMCVAVCCSVLQCVAVSEDIRDKRCCCA